MKKILYALLAGSSMLTAQNPLYISTVTFTPHGCSTATTPATVDISATGAGGSPSAEGYTFTLSGAGITTPLVKTGKTVTFPNIAPLTASQSLTLAVKDNSAQGTSISYQITSLTQSQSKSISFTIDSLPLDNEPGCITLSVTNPVVGSIAFGVNPLNNPSRQVQLVRQAPFSKTFSAFAQSGQLLAQVTALNDCTASPTASSFGISFPFPQGQGNALNKFIYKKLCSCALSPNTIPV